MRFRYYVVNCVQCAHKKNILSSAGDREGEAWHECILCVTNSHRIILPSVITLPDATSCYIGQCYIKNRLNYCKILSPCTLNYLSRHWRIIMDEFCHIIQSSSLIMACTLDNSVFGRATSEAFTRESTSPNVWCRLHMAILSALLALREGNPLATDAFSS